MSYYNDNKVRSSLYSKQHRTTWVYEDCDRHQRYLNRKMKNDFYMNALIVLFIFAYAVKFLMLF